MWVKWVKYVENCLRMWEMDEIGFKRLKYVGNG